MKLTTLQERIANAEAKIAKKRNTIEKKTALIAKKRANMDKVAESDKWWAESEISILTEDIERGGKEIKAIEKSLEDYRKQLAGEMEREALITELPTNLKRMQRELVERWDAWDIKHREVTKDIYCKMEYREFVKKYGYSAYEEMYLTDEQIHNANERDARALILNLIYRVKDHVGEITDWSNIRATAGTCGCTVLNGWVEGTQGRCMIESIEAGGWNIQRLHIRVLVKDYN